MSLIKKISSVSVLLVIAFSFALTVSAQGYYATEQDLAQLNSQPEVYVKNLVLDKTNYKAGDTVTGSFTLQNVKDISVSNLSYQGILVGDPLPSTFYRYKFDNQILGTLFLDKNETKKINFEYKLPLSSSAYTLGKQLAIEIKAFSGGGLPLGWADTNVSISDSGITPVDITDALVSVSGKDYKLNEGPMVYSGGKVSLKLTVNNDSVKDIIGLTPKFSIYEMDYARDPLLTFSEKLFSVPANNKLDFNFDLPTFNYTPKVYAGEMVIVDGNGVSRTDPVRFRYIVYGEVVNINNVLIDKESAKAGETVNVKIDYTGTPFDITNFSSATTTPSDFSLKLFNESDELVAQYSDKTVFGSAGIRNVSLVLNEGALAFKAEILVMKNDKIITEYKTTLTNKLEKIIADAQKAQKTKNIIYVSLIILILIISGAVLFAFRKKKRVLMFLILLFVGLGVTVNKAEAFKTTYLYVDDDSFDQGFPPKITVNSPQGSYLPGETINLTGVASMPVCHNSDYDIVVYAALNKVPTENPEYVVGGKNNGYLPCVGNDGNHSRCYDQTSFSHSFIAPNNPGTYRIYIHTTDFWIGASGGSKYYAVQTGYQEFTVVAPPPPVLSTTIATCGGNVALSWNEFAGASDYQIFKNGTTFLATTTDTFYETTASTGDSFMVKVYLPYFTVGSDIAVATITVTKTKLTPGLVTSNTQYRYDLSWPAKPNAIGYEVYSKGNYLATVTGATYSMTGPSAVMLFTVKPIYSAAVTLSSNSITPTPSDPCAVTSLTASCTATSDNDFVAISNVTWAVTADGTPPYTYFWTGSGVDGNNWTAGDLVSVAKNYPVSGTYYANVEVTDSANPAQSITVDCMGNVNGGASPGIIVNPATIPVCTDFTYSDWSPCTNNTQTKTVTHFGPVGCEGGSPEPLSKSCGDTVVSSCTLSRTDVTEKIIMNTTYTDWSAISEPLCPGCDKQWIEINSQGIGTIIPPSYTFSNNRYVLSDYPFGSSGDKTIVMKIFNSDDSSVTCPFSVHVYSSPEEAAREH